MKSQKEEPATEEQCMDKTVAVNITMDGEKTKVCDSISCQTLCP